MTLFCPFRWTVVLAGVVTSTAGALGQEPAAGGTYQAWRAHRDKVLASPAILRYYTFEGLAPTDARVPNLANQGGDLTLGPASAPGQPAQLTLVDGRWPEKKAVRLDRDVLSADPFPVTEGAFTLTAWFRTRGLGIHRGDSVPLGATLFSAGSGYWDGFRVTLLEPDKSLGLEIGRPRPGHSIGIRSGPETDGVWHHLGAVWDGQRMRLHLDGRLIAQGDYAGPYAPPKPGERFRVGFAGSGWGGAMLEVDELAVYGRAWSPTEVLRDAHFHAALPDAVATRFEAASVAAAAGNLAAAAAEYARIVATKDLHADYLAVARLGLAAALGGQKRAREAATEAGHVAENAAVVACHRRTALAMLVRLVRETGAPASPSALRTLLADPGLAPPDRVRVLLALARQASQSGDLAEARTCYAEAIAMREAEPRQRLDARLELGHACAAAGQYDAARKVHASLVALADAPLVYRVLAQRAIAVTYVREKNFSAAREAYGRLAAMPGVLPHHRAEAEECQREIDRLAQGLPARDPAVSRLALPQPSVPRIEFFVAPDGKDQNPGSRQQPFASLERARDALRSLKRDGTLPPGGAAVVVRGGVYRRHETFRLTPEDSGTASSPIVYRAAPGETPVFTGGVTIRGFRPVDDASILARLPEKSRGKVLQVDLQSQGVTDLGELRPRGFGRGESPMLELFFDGRPMPVARWPNDGFARVGKVIEAGGKPGTAAGFEDEGDRPSRWTQARQAWLFGYWHYLWADGTLGIASIDPQNRRIKTAQPYTYGGGILAGMPYYVFNVLEEIDAPGEWYLDRDSGMLYFCPPSDPTKAAVEVSVLAQPMVELDNVSHVALQGLVFELGRGDGIVVRGGQRCLLAGCTVRRLGGDAVTIDGGTGHGLLSCDLHTLGRGGARIRGGDRKTLTPSGHFVENCHVYDFSRVDRTYTPALWTDGVGTRVAHNRFHGSPCHAARLEGNDHLVEFNEVFDVVRESDDQGGMEMFGNPTYRGVVFRWNYFHDIGGRYDWPCGQAGIRLDDAISGVLVYGNVFQRCSRALFGGVQIHGGQENVVENNVFLECRHAVSFSGWGQARWNEFLKSNRVVQQTTHEVDISKPPYSTRYPALARLAENPDVNHLWRNLAVGCGTFLARDRGIQDVAANVLRGDADRFADRSGKRPHLDPAVLESAGLRPIPFDEIGLYPDEHRRALPP